MQKQWTLIYIFMLSTVLISCNSSGLSKYYGQCNEGATKCNNDNLEECSSYGEWTLKTECSFYGGTCVTEGGSSYCANMENDGEISDTYITDWGEEETDDGAEETQDYDNYLWIDVESSDDASEGDDAIYDSDITDSDLIVDNDIADEDVADDMEDEDVIIPECGNAVVEEGEVCEKGTLKNCIEIDPVLYSGGKAFCLDDCSGYNLLTCDEIETGDED